MNEHSPKSKPQVIELEGGDGSGKNEAAIAAADQLLKQGWQVLFTNYPTYWSPTGLAVREMNTSGKEAHAYTDSLDPYREACVRTAMYALDRALTLSIVEAQLDRLNPHQTKIVSDRGPYSNLVTTAYMIALQKLTSTETPQFIERMVPNIDQEMVRRYDLHPILCTTAHYNYCGGRESLDILERSADAQELANQFYRNAQLPEVVTRTPRGWRDIESIARDILQTTGLFLERPFQQDTSERALVMIGPHTLLPSLGITQISDNLETAISFWKYFQATPFLDSKKDNLYYLEPHIAGMICRELHTANLHVFSDYPISQIAIKRLTNEYPELLNILELATDRYTRTFVKRIAQV